MTTLDEYRRLIGPYLKFDAANGSPHETTPDEAAATMRRVIQTQQDVRHAVYRADIGYIDFIWGDEGKWPPNAKGSRKGAKGIAHLLEARIRKNNLTQVQAEQVAEQAARVLITGQKSPSIKSGTDIKITDGKYTAVIVKDPGTDAWLLTGWENS